MTISAFTVMNAIIHRSMASRRSDLCVVIDKLVVGGTGTANHSCCSRYIHITFCNLLNSSNFKNGKFCMIWMFSHIANVEISTLSMKCEFFYKCEWGNFHFMSNFPLFWYFHTRSWGCLISCIYQGGFNMRLVLNISYRW